MKWDPFFTTKCERMPAPTNYPAPMINPSHQSTEPPISNIPSEVALLVKFIALVYPVALIMLLLNQVHEKLINVRFQEEV